MRIRARDSRLVLGSVILACASVLVPNHPLVGAQVPSAATTEVSESESPTLSEIFPEPRYLTPDVISALTIDPTRLGISELIEVRTNLADARGRLDVATIAFAESSTDVVRGIDEERESQASHAEADALARQAGHDLAAFAIGSFTGSELRDLETKVFSGELTPQITLQAAAEDRMLNDKVSADARLEVATEDLAAKRAQLSADRLALFVAEIDIAVATSDIATGEDAVSVLTPEAERKLAQATDPNLGFTVSALDAYFNAELVMAELDPECGVQWWQLAGIGRVESIHGTYGGSRVNHLGDTTRRILGPPLDGVEFLAIPDSDAGRLDGDLVWDRAVGPMQFIPGSWRVFSADGNNDGAENPNNMYDATVAAGKHLCGSVRGITASGRFRRALLGYNRSVEYGQIVDKFARRYDSEIELVALPDPTAKQQILCQPKPDKFHLLNLLGCGPIGRSAAFS